MTTTTARVRGVSAAAMVRAFSMWSGPTSAKTGRAPALETAVALARKEYGVTTTSSPRPTPSASSAR